MADPETMTPPSRQQFLRALHCAKEGTVRLRFSWAFAAASPYVKGGVASKSLRCSPPCQGDALCEESSQGASLRMTAGEPRGGLFIEKSRCRRA